MEPTRDRIAVLRSNGALFAIAEVTDTHITVQGWVHRETLTLRDFAIRYDVREVQERKPTDWDAAISSWRGK